MSAVLSPCGLYRYRLERSELVPIGECAPLAGKTLAFFGVNPSTADASIDDATVRKWVGFCRRWGVQRFIVGNVFSYRATDVRALKKAHATQGPEHFRHIADIIAEADVLVPCWGSSAKLPSSLRGHLETLLFLLQSSGKPLATFGFTECGQPKHPLMLGYDTPLTLQ